VIAAVEDAKAQIIDHIDEIANADVQACVRAHTIEFADIDRMSPAIRQLWAQDATFCAAQATEYFSAVATLRAADNIGFLISEIYAIATVARAAAGFSTVALIENHIRANEAVVSRLTPTDCQRKGYKDEGYPVERWWECVAYNGDVGLSGLVYAPGQPSRTEAEDRATRFTSRAVAAAALPKLREALASA
jgi:hypothetical protein